MFRLSLRPVSRCFASSDRANVSRETFASAPHPSAARSLFCAGTVMAIPTEAGRPLSAHALHLCFSCTLRPSPQLHPPTPRAHLPVLAPHPSTAPSSTASQRSLRFARRHQRTWPIHQLTAFVFPCEENAKLPSQITYIICLYET